MPYTSHMNIRAHLGDIWLIKAGRHFSSEKLVRIVKVDNFITKTCLTIEYINIPVINPLVGPPYGYVPGSTFHSCSVDWLERNGTPLPDNRMTRILYG